MEKKMYYKIDNGDVYQIVDESIFMDIIKGEASDYNEYKNEQDKPEWIITLAWMTQEEYENLPEAY